MQCAVYIICHNNRGDQMITDPSRYKRMSPFTTYFNITGVDWSHKTKVKPAKLRCGRRDDLRFYYTLLCVKAVNRSVCKVQIPQTGTVDLNLRRDLSIQRIMPLPTGPCSTLLSSILGLTPFTGMGGGGISCLLKNKMRRTVSYLCLLTHIFH